jgi:hypothetical protein
VPSRERTRAARHELSAPLLADLNDGWQAGIGTEFDLIGYDDLLAALARGE